MTNFRDSFRKTHDEGTEVDLPSSGSVVRLRSIDAQAVLFADGLAEELTSTALDAIITGKIDPDKVDGKIDWKEMFGGSQKHIEAVCRAAFIEPRIMPDDTDPETLSKDEILYGWLDPIDREFVVRLMNKPVREWRRFREQSSEYVDGVREIAGAGQDTE